MDKTMIAHTCPVLWFTPEVAGWFDLFYACHESVFVDGVPTWRRIALPGPGGVLDQDALEFDAITWIADTWNYLIRVDRLGRPRG